MEQQRNHNGIIFERDSSSQFNQEILITGQERSPYQGGFFVVSTKKIHMENEGKDFIRVNFLTPVQNPRLDYDTKKKDFELERDVDYPFPFLINLRECFFGRKWNTENTGFEHSVEDEQTLIEGREREKKVSYKDIRKSINRKAMFYHVNNENLRRKYLIHYDDGYEVKKGKQLSKREIKDYGERNDVCVRSIFMKCVPPKITMKKLGKEGLCEQISARSFTYGEDDENQTEKINGFFFRGREFYIFHERIRDKIDISTINDVDECLDVLKSVFEYVHLIHKKGIIHGNINKNTIYVSRSKEDKIRVKFGNFKVKGMEKFLNKEKQKQKLIRNKQGEKSFTKDLYSIAIFIYDLLIGNVCLPFIGLGNERDIQRSEFVLEVLLKQINRKCGGERSVFKDLLKNCITGKENDYKDRKKCGEILDNFFYDLDNFERMRDECIKFFGKGMNGWEYVIDDEYDDDEEEEEEGLKRKDILVRSVEFPPHNVHKCKIVGEEEIDRNNDDSDESQEEEEEEEEICPPSFSEFEEHEKKKEEELNKRHEENELKKEKVLKKTIVRNKGFKASDLQQMKKELKKAVTREKETKNFTSDHEKNKNLIIHFNRQMLNKVVPNEHREVKKLIVTKMDVLCEEVGHFKKQKLNKTETKEFNYIDFLRNEELKKKEKKKKRRRFFFFF